MTTARVLVAGYAALIPLGVDPGRGVRALLVALCLAALLAVGEMWLRALPAESVAAPARLGLAAAAGLGTLPIVAMALHGIGEPIRTAALAAGLAVVLTVLGAVALVRERRVRPAADPRLGRTAAAVAIPTVVLLAVSGAAVTAYARLPHPPPPGYTSVALNGWAAGIDRPVTFPPAGLTVPLRVSSAGLPAATEPLRVRVGDRLSEPRPITVEPHTTRSLDVHVPAPPDGCLHRIEITLGTAGTVFYGYGPAAC